MTLWILRRIYFRSNGSAKRRPSAKCFERPTPNVFGANRTQPTIVQIWKKIRTACTRKAKKKMTRKKKAVLRRCRCQPIRATIPKNFENRVMCFAKCLPSPLAQIPTRARRWTMTRLTKTGLFTGEPTALASGVPVATALARSPEASAVG